MSPNNRLSNAYNRAKTIPFDDTSKFILFSDCHRGDNSFSDEFANNRNIYYHALKHYFNNGFQYCELGDGDELWENLSFEPIFEVHKNIYMLMKLFQEKNRLHMIYGNHDMVYRNPEYVKKHLYTYFEPKDEKEATLLDQFNNHCPLVP